MMDENTMKSQSPPLPVRITLNQEGTEAILHINCQSDGRVERWLEDKEESSDQAKQVWLSKLGCLLRVHWDFEYKFNDPWAYRIADFPKNYKLFAVGRQTGGDNSPREDHYLCGGNYDYRSPQEFYPHMHWLLKSTQGVEEKCICKHCNHPTNQRDINKIFWLPPHKESPKGPTGPKKNKKPRKLQAPRGVTSQRGMVMNRNSITTGPVATLGYEGQMQKAIGFKTSHPFQP